VDAAVRGLDLERRTPFVLSPLVGWAVDRLGFEPVFILGAGVIAGGAIVATGLPEPRHLSRAGQTADGG
jgi:hypothetical protein